MAKIAPAVCVVLAEPPRRHSPAKAYAYKLGFSGRRRDWHPHPRRPFSAPVLLIETEFSGRTWREAAATALRTVRTVLPFYSWETVNLGKRRISS